MTFLEALSKNVRAAAQYNASVQVATAVILWPDKDREWLPMLMQLQAMLPELFSLGAYARERRQGPNTGMNRPMGIAALILRGPT
jgi:hypothetical protein